MDIAWIGHAAFRLRGHDAAVVVDPCPASTGFRLGRPQAEIVTVSNASPEHSWFAGVGGDPVCLDAPGEYEIRNVLITGVDTAPASARLTGTAPERAIGTPPADATGTAPPGETERAADNPPRNVAFVVTIDEVIIAHLGDIGAEPGAAALEELSRADILLLPVGGHGHLDAKTAVAIVGLIDPKLVVPMLYKVGSEAADLDAVDAFLSAMGGVVPTELDNHINITRAQLGEHTVVQVLAPRGD